MIKITTTITQMIAAKPISNSGMLQLSSAHDENLVVSLAGVSSLESLKRITSVPFYSHRRRFGIPPVSGIIILIVRQCCDPGSRSGRKDKELSRMKNNDATSLTLDLDQSETQARLGMGIKLQLSKNGNLLLSHLSRCLEREYAIRTGKNTPDLNLPIQNTFDFEEYAIADLRRPMLTSPVFRQLSKRMVKGRRQNSVTQ